MTADGVMHWFESFSVPTGKVEDGKLNLITGFDVGMGGTGGRGPKPETNASQEYKAWQASGAAWFKGWLAAHPNATDPEIKAAIDAWLAANPEPPRTGNPASQPGNWGY
jgi:hypothetical protein